MKLNHKATVIAVILLSSFTIASAATPLTLNLSRGMKNGQVRQLQGFLAQYPDIYPEANISGYFGALTEKAVQRYQKKNGLDSIGILGPKTRALINRAFTSAGAESTSRTGTSTQGTVNTSATLAPVSTPQPTALSPTSWSNVQLSHNDTYNSWMGPTITGGVSVQAASTGTSMITTREYGLAWVGRSYSVDNLFFEKIDQNGTLVEGPNQLTMHGHCNDCGTVSLPNIAASEPLPAKSYLNGFTPVYGIVWIDNQEESNGKGAGYSIRFEKASLVNGAWNTSILLSIPGESVQNVRPGIKWTGSAFAVTWADNADPYTHVSSRYYAEVSVDGGSVITPRRAATAAEWNYVNTPLFTATATAHDGNIYFSDTGTSDERVSEVAGVNSGPFIVRSENRYAIVWTNIQLDKTNSPHLQTYFSTK